MAEVTSCHMNKGGGGVRTRNCSRIVVVNSDQQILLLKYKDATPVDPTRPDILEYWVPPGGGTNPGETFEDAARRELEEETGIFADIGPCIWSRRRRLYFRNELVHHLERYFVAWTGTRPVIATNRTSEPIVAFRWWPLDEIRKSSEIFLPLSFAELVEPILRGGVPSEPIEIDHT